MNRESDMISAKHTMSSTLARKRNRSPTEMNMPSIDKASANASNPAASPVLAVPKLEFRASSFSPSVQQQQQQQAIQIGVFGVDANKRINMWNESAAAVTGTISKNNQGNCNGCTEELQQEYHLTSQDDETPVMGMLFDEVFPRSSYEVSSEEDNTGGGQCPTTPVASFGDVLDRVLSTGEASTSVPVVARAGRKRGRDEITAGFAVDLLPQFDSGHPQSNGWGDAGERKVSGVVLVCKNTGSGYCYDGASSRKALDQSLDLGVMPDKPRSFSGGSAGTCTTETPTETETTDDIADEEDDEDDEEGGTEVEIDSSFHTCQAGVDGSYRSSQVETSFHTAAGDNSIAVLTTCNSNRQRLENLEPFTDDDDVSEEGSEPKQRRFHLPSPPLYNADADVTHTDGDYRMLFETMDAIAFGVDIHGNINEWNQKIEALTGITKNAAMGRSFLEDQSLPFLPHSLENYPRDMTEALRLQTDFGAALTKAFNGESIPYFRFKVKRKGAILEESDRVDDFKTSARNMHKFLFLIGSISPRYNKDKQIVGAMFLASDMTEGNAKMGTLRLEAHRLRTLIDTANAPIFGIDANGVVNEWNNKTAEITGFGKSEARGKSLVDTFIFPDLRDSVRGILQKALQHGEGTSNYELEFKTKCNEIRHLLVNVTPQNGRNDVVEGVVFIAQDVTKAVARDRAVRSMAVELRQLIDTANAPIFGIDVNGKVNEWNTRMSTITGFPKEEATGMPLVENFIAPSMKEKVGEILQAALNGNETSNYEVQVTSKSGEPIFLLVNATTRRDPSSDIIGVVGVAQDVTEDRRHARALRDLETVRASQEAKVETERNMTAYFAHELRNPLHAIDSALIAMPEKLPENVQSLVCGMRQSTKFMSSIMNNLLDVRKMEEGKMRLEIKPVSIKKLLQNVYSMLAPSVKEGVDFQKLVNVRNNDWVKGDAHRIEQVMTNVVSNAVKYTSSGHIQISIEWEGDNLKFICKDTGPGIPVSEQARLFQRFFKWGGAPGTGLGLAIAKHLVDLMEGSIRFESDPDVAAGTTCVVLMALPRCQAPEDKKKKKADFITEPISILVIDDIRMNRMMVKKRILKGIAPNAKIREAATGEDALLICGKERFDVMIVDQYMESAGGVMVGTDVVFAMRRMRIESVLIGCSGNDIGTQFFDAGADMVWQKPMPSNDQIIRDLRSTLSARGIMLSSSSSSSI